MLFTSSMETAQLLNLKQAINRKETIAVMVVLHTPLDLQT